MNRSTRPWFLAGGLALGLNWLGDLCPDILYPVFALPAAQLAGLFFNQAPGFNENGLLVIPMATSSIIVTPDCGGYGFFCLITAVLAVFHQDSHWRIPSIAKAGITFGLAYLITIMTNSCRIICGYQCHQIFIHDAPVAVANLVHLFIGITIFLTVLILVYLILERKAGYDRIRSQTSSA